MVTTPWDPISKGTATWDPMGDTTASAWDLIAEGTAIWDLRMPWRTGWGHGSFAHQSTGPDGQKDDGFGHGYVGGKRPWDSIDKVTTAWDEIT